MSGRDYMKNAHSSFGWWTLAQSSHWASSKVPYVRDVCFISWQPFSVGGNGYIYHYPNDHGSTLLVLIKATISF